MGAWGTSLYSNDTTSDIRGDYVDMLRRGKTNEEATQALIDKNSDIFGDEEEEPLFWYALADTQWLYGRLLPEVKDKALYFLGQTAELERWRGSGEASLKKWEQTLDKLKTRLLSPQPPEKKVYKYRLYKCKWKLGDVYAYRFGSEYSREKGFYGQYIAFQKVAEDIWWPGHIIPVVHVYKWIGNEIPALADLSKFDLLEQFYVPAAYEKSPEMPKKYNLGLLNTSPKVIPTENLSYLGNLPVDELKPGGGIWNSGYCVGWEKRTSNAYFEKYMIDIYIAWRDKD